MVQAGTNAAQLPLLWPQLKRVVIVSHQNLSLGKCWIYCFEQITNYHRKFSGEL